MATLLLIEDDPDVRDLLQHALASAGHDVASASNGEEALLRLRQGLLPGFIVLDLMLPQRNGWEFLDALVADARWRKIPVVVQSGYADLNLYLPMPPVVRVLKKPFDLVELIATVQAIVTP